MSSASTCTPSLTPASSRSTTPAPPIQPDHFYGSETAHLPPSPDFDGRPWLNPSDDPWAQRGIPVFKPTMEEFQDFEAYLNRIECWGMRSGIVKVIPPKDWSDALPPLTDQLSQVKLKNPIEQHMFGRGGLFRQENVEKRRIMSVREWAELCSKEDLRAPGIDDIGLHARAVNGSARPRTRRARKKRESETAEPDTGAHAIKEEEEEATNQIVLDGASQSVASPPNSTAAPASPGPAEGHTGVWVVDELKEDQTTDATVEGVHEGRCSEEDTKREDDKFEEAEGEQQPRARRKRVTQSRQAREASLAERAIKDKTFLESFDPLSDWLPPNTTPFDYTPEFCKELERRYWRNCGLGKPAWYGADMQGSLFTDETKSWNVAHLESALTRILPASSKGLPGVNTPYLYFGMWRATFAWHVEDMDLFSINYVHFGAPKHWYAIPQAKAQTLETVMRGYFPSDVSNCSQFLRHKSFLASPHLLSQSSCRPNTLVQRAGEFVITFPMGYHAGFNLGFNCAESVNFALDSWIDIGRKAKACGCVNFSVRIDVDQLLRDREAEGKVFQPPQPSQSKSESTSDREAKLKITARKRKTEKGEGGSPHKKQKISKAKNVDNQPSEPSTSKIGAKPSAAKVTLRLPPKPKESDVFPCCLCVSMSQENLLRVHDPPLWRIEGEGGSGIQSNSAAWMAHEFCANIVPETWVDEVDVGDVGEDGTRATERVVFGVDAIVKDRWNLKCSACTKTRHKSHGAPIQCTKGKCPKAFHVSCARDGGPNNIVYKELREVEKEVVLLVPQRNEPALGGPAHAPHEPQPIYHGPVLTSNVNLTAFATTASDARGTDIDPCVLKVVRKVEVQVLCPQHNPAVTEAKRAIKQDKIRNDLLALPPMSRIKLRVSAGVFEVSIVRVIEESCSIEVLWDRGLKREFKWGSVVFGNTEGVPVGQKPSQPAPEPESAAVAPSSSQTKFKFAPLSSTTPTLEYRQQLPAPMPVPASNVMTPALTTTPSAQPTSPTPSYPYRHPPAYPPATSNYHYTPANWRYHPQSATSHHAHYMPAPSIAHSYPYSSSMHAPYSNTTSYESYAMYSQAPAQTSRGLQWQRPYTGPKATSSTAAASTPQIAPNCGYTQASTPGQAGSTWMSTSSTPTTNTVGAASTAGPTQVP